jgi:ribulose-5-phosphate 4-epimerase/fuculose-1-phosphate aldolase
MIPCSDRFLVIQYGLSWSEVTPENLVCVDASGMIISGEGPVETTAFEIHRAIHLADPEKYACVLHTHQPYATALCCAQGKPRGLSMCHQNACRFFDEVSFDETFNGLVTDSREGERLAEAMRGRRVLLHSSHGVMVCGRSVAEAFDDLYCAHQP